MGVSALRVAGIYAPTAHTSTYIHTYIYTLYREYTLYVRCAGYIMDTGNVGRRPSGGGYIRSTRRVTCIFII